MKLACVFVLIFSVCSYALEGPLSRHFQDWLLDNGYSSEDFAQIQFGTNGSFGGKETSEQTLNHIPVIFIHGNSDGALTDGTIYGTGWTNSVEYFLSQNYTMAELYGTSWGDRNRHNALNRTFNCQNINYIRKFMEAVLQYTEAEFINVITHSMGTIIGRKAILGGSIRSFDSNCNLGSRLRYVKTFVGISGANYGICFCSSEIFSVFPGCNAENGYHPGKKISKDHDCVKPGSNANQTNYSKLLEDINNNKFKEAVRIFTIFSKDDELIGNDGLVYSDYTSRIPHEDVRVKLSNHTHMETKDLTAEMQYQMINGVGGFNML